MKEACHYNQTYYFLRCKFAAPYKLPKVLPDKSIWPHTCMYSCLFIYDKIFDSSYSTAILCIYVECTPTPTLTLCIETLRISDWLEET